MKKNFLFFGFIGMVAVLFSACYYDNEEQMYVKLNTDCDLTNVTFTKDVMPIVKDNCLTCHSTANAPASGDGNVFDSYATISANSAIIMSSINHTGSVQMPKDGGKLDDCKIKKMQKWIDNGKLNN